MSNLTSKKPKCIGTSGAIARRLEPQEIDSGEFTVRRVLPSSKRQMVGTYIFFDHMSPADFPPGQGIKVRSHPHIGLATINYLFEGEIIRANSCLLTPLVPFTECKNGRCCTARFGLAWFAAKREMDSLRDKTNYRSDYYKGEMK